MSALDATGVLSRPFPFDAAQVASPTPSLATTAGPSPAASRHVDVVVPLKAPGPDEFDQLPSRKLLRRRSRSASRSSVDGGDESDGASARPKVKRRKADAVAATVAEAPPARSTRSKAKPRPVLKPEAMVSSPPSVIEPSKLEPIRDLQHSGQIVMTPRKPIETMSQLVSREPELDDEPMGGHDDPQPEYDIGLASSDGLLAAIADGADEQFVAAPVAAVVDADSPTAQPTTTQSAARASPARRVTPEIVSEPDAAAELSDSDEPNHALLAQLQDMLTKLGAKRKGKTGPVEVASAQTLRVSKQQRQSEDMDIDADGTNAAFSAKLIRQRSSCGRGRPCSRHRRRPSCLRSRGLVCSSRHASTSPGRPIALRLRSSRICTPSSTYATARRVHALIQTAGA